MLLCAIHIKHRQMRINMKKDKKNTFKLVQAISKGENVDAYKLLEKAMKDRIARRIDDAIKDI